MKEITRKNILWYGITVLIGLALAWSIIWYKGIPNDVKGWFMSISDGCFVTAVLFVGVGGLIKISSTGALDMLGYGFHSLLYLFTPIKKKDKGGFYEYKLERKEKRKEMPMYILWIGLVFLAVAGLFTLLWYKG